MQCVPFKCNEKVISKLQETDPHYVKLIKNIKLKNEISIRDHRLYLHGVLYKKIQGHGKEFRALIVPKVIQKYVLYEI